MLYDCSIELIIVKKEMSAEPSAGPSAAKRTRRGNDDGTAAVEQRNSSVVLASKDFWARTQSEVVELNFKWVR